MSRLQTSLLAFSLRLAPARVLLVELLERTEPAED